MFLYRLRIQKLNKCTCNVFCSGVGKNREQKEILRKWHNWWRCRWIPNYQGWTFTFFLLSMKGLGCLNKRRCGRRLNYWGWTCIFCISDFRFCIFLDFCQEQEAVRCGWRLNCRGWTCSAGVATKQPRSQNWLRQQVLILIRQQVGFQNNWQALDRESGLQSLNM